MTMLGYASTSSPFPISTCEHITDTQQSQEPMVNGILTGNCNRSPYWIGDHFLRLQGTSRYLRSFNGGRGIIWPYGWDHGAGITRIFPQLCLFCLL